MYPFDLLKVRLHLLLPGKLALRVHRHDYKSSILHLAAFTPVYQMPYRQYQRRRVSGPCGEAYQVWF